THCDRLRLRRPRGYRGRCRRGRSAEGGRRGTARSARRRPCFGRLPAPPRAGAGLAGGPTGPGRSRVVPEPVSEQPISVTINGEVYEQEVEARKLLVHFIRDVVDLTGTHVGCDTGNCGACTVLMDGQTVKSCMLLAIQADGSTITTVEGLAGADGELTPLQ